MTRWQPSSCMLHMYKPHDLSKCLSHSRIVYIGDSIVRTQYMAAVRLIKKDVITEGPRHSNRKYTFEEDNLTLEFWWDPYLNTTHTLELINGDSAMVRPSLLVIGSGLWHMRYLQDDYFKQWKPTIDHLFQSLKSRKIADATVLSPIEIPEYDELSQERAQYITMDRVNKMNGYLEDKQKMTPTSATPFAIPFVWNKMASHASNVTEDGLHYSNEFASTQAQIAYNYRCNDVISKQFPMDSTCCYNYPRPRWYQNMFFILFLVWVPVGYFILSADGFPGLARKLFPSENVLTSLFVFGLSVVYMYMGDRTQLFGKIHKDFDAIIFTSLLMTAAIIGVVKLVHNKKDSDLGYLNRHQTDEWKGWMQLIILIYHYCGASSVSGIYNAVRILVAAYLFQTGYGHFFYFYKKADFGIGRVLNVMVRLNLLTFVLQYLMDTNYLSYYFTPLVSLWFLVIWLIMYIGHTWNKNPLFIISKIIVSCAITTTLIKVPGILEFIFDVLEVLFNIHWSAGEWRFRLGLDAYIVYVGMLSAYGYIKVMEYKWMEHPKWSIVKIISVASSLLCLIWYFWFELTRENKFVYNGIHPYISWIPILAFTVLRNSTHCLRNTHSPFFAFIGKISLETFIGQFHMWLAADTKGLLVLLSVPHWVSGFGWWVNLALSSFLFIAVCHYLSQATQVISGWICKKTINQPENMNRGDYQSVPLLPTDTTSTSKNLSLTDSSDEQKTKDPLNLEAGADNIDKRSNEEDMWITPSDSDNTSTFTKIINDTRTKIVLFIVFVGLLNNFC